MALSDSPPETAHEPYQFTARVHRIPLYRDLFKGMGKRDRKNHQYARVPISTLLVAANLGRGKYRAIICITWLSMYWDGWETKGKRGKKSKRVKSDKVLFTRRMMSEHYGYSEGLIRRGLDDLKRAELISVATVGFHTNRRNSGTYYNLSWMPGKGLQRINLYWGLLSSELFLGLDTTLQAVLVMLHTLHNRKKNRLTIKPTSLSHFKVSRNKLPVYVNALRHAGLLELVDFYIYAFPWITDEGKPDFDDWTTKLLEQKIKIDAPNCTKGCT